METDSSTAFESPVSANSSDCLHDGLTAQCLADKVSYAFSLVFFVVGEGIELGFICRVFDPDRVQNQMRIFRDGK